MGCQQGRQDKMLRESIVAEIARLDVQADARAFSEKEWAHHYALEGQVEALLRAEEEYWRRRGGLKWTVKRGANTKYFQAYANGRRRKDLSHPPSAAPLLYQIPIGIHSTQPDRSDHLPRSASPPNHSKPSSIIHPLHQPPTSSLTLEAVLLVSAPLLRQRLASSPPKPDLSFSHARALLHVLPRPTSPSAELLSLAPETSPASQARAPQRHPRLLCLALVRVDAGRLRPDQLGSPLLLSAALVASRSDSSDPCFVPLLVVPPTRSPTTQPASVSSLLEELQHPRTTASTSPASSASSLQLAHAPLADLPLRRPKLRPRRRAPPCPSHRAVPASSASRSFAAANSLPLPSASPATSRATAAPTRRASAPSPAKDLSHPPSRAATLPNPHRDPFHPTRSLRPPPSFCVAAQPQQALLDHPSTPPATHTSSLTLEAVLLVSAPLLRQRLASSPPKPDLSFSHARALLHALPRPTSPSAELLSLAPETSPASQARAPLHHPRLLCLALVRVDAGRLRPDRLGSPLLLSAALVASRLDSSDPCFVPLLVVPPTRSPTTQPASVSSLLEELQ
nr:proline-rich protein 36-like [Aegilops tauschii subsp. strangulata]